MHKIVVTNNQNLSTDQKHRLNSLGDVTYFDSLPQSREEYLKRVEGADIICSGTAGLQDAFAELKDVYVTVAFVSVAFVDLETLSKNNVVLSNAPGANQHAVSEWIIAMMILLMRNLNDSINRDETYRVDGALPPTTSGLAGKNLTILGNGNIGKRVSKLAEAFDMKVRMFQRGDNLYEAAQGADVVVDALSANKSSKGLLNEAFFEAMKDGSRFVTITRSEITDTDALLSALDSGKLAGAASDCGGILVGDTEDELYSLLRQHPKVIATPHISYNSEMSRKRGADIMIDNIEAYINGNPQNIVTR